MSALSYTGFCLAAMLWLAAILAGSLGVGRVLLRGAGFRDLARYEETVFGTGLGLALLSYTILAGAAFKLLSPSFLWGVSGLWLLAAALNRLPWALPPDERTQTKAPVWRMVLMVFLAATSLLNLLSALAPAVDWDGVAYHLALPKIYLAAGGLVFRPDIFHNLFPQFTEMLFLPGLLFPFGVGAKLVHFGFGLLAAATVYAACRQSGLRTGAWLGAAIFYGQYLIHIESGTAFIDLATAAYAGLSLMAWQRALRPGAPQRWLDLALFSAGLCAATKWHGLIVLALLAGLALVFILHTPAPAGAKLGKFARAVFWGFLPVAPYLFRAWREGGNPVWPLAYKIFGGLYWDNGFAERISRLARDFAGTQHGWLGLARLPYDFVVHGSSFGVGGAELRWPVLGLTILGAAWLFFSPGRTGNDASFTRAAGGWLAWTVAALAAFIGLWFFSSPQVRFLIPLFPIAAWLAARALATLWTTPSAAARVAAVAGGLLLFAFHPPVHRDTANQARLLLGRLNPHDYCAQWLEHYPACRYLNTRTPAGGKVLLFGENRGFYLDGLYVWGDPLLQKVLDYRALETPQRLLARLRELQVRRVLYRPDLYPPDYLDPGIIRLMAEALRRQGRMTYRQGSVEVWELEDSKGIGR